MRNCEEPSCLTPGHSLWSHQRKRIEGASAARLHFRVSRIVSLEVTHNKRSRYAKLRSTPVLGL
jgi:hypothetical protein